MGLKGYEVTPGDSSSGPIINASGATEAAAFTAIAPDSDGFVCARQLAAARCQAGGIAIRIGAQGVPGTGSTIIGTLTVMNLSDGVPLPESLTVCDFRDGHLFNPAAGAVLRLARPSLGATAYEGQEVGLVWNETGDLAELDGARPTLHMLGWPLVACEPTSF